MDPGPSPSLPALPNILEHSFNLLHETKERTVYSILDHSVIVFNETKTRTVYSILDHSIIVINETKTRTVYSILDHSVNVLHETIKNSLLLSWINGSDQHLKWKANL